MEEQEREKWILAGKIAKEARELGASLSKPGASLLSIAEAIEKKLAERGAKPAFPPNLSLNAVAAHYTPRVDDMTELSAGDVLKVDVGASVEGFISDTATTVLVGGGENDVLEASREALSEASKLVRPGGSISEISKAIENKIRSYNLSPIVNLGGHGLAKFDIHTAPFIPNVFSSSSKSLPDSGAIAIEPFATNGVGFVIDGAEVEIMMLSHKKPVRSKLGREIMDFVENEYNTLPFARRWIIKKFGPFADSELKNLAAGGNLYEFNVLKEQGGGLVAQFEDTFLLDGGTVITTTV
jgi:methionyl aminopeptidase